MSKRHRIPLTISADDRGEAGTLHLPLFPYDAESSCVKEVTLVSSRSPELHWKRSARCTPKDEDFLL